MKKSGISGFLTFVILWGMCVTLWPSATAAAADTEMLPNPGFESTSDGRPSQWEPLPNSSTIESVSESVYVLSGTYSVKLVDPVKGGATGLRSAKMPVTEGKDYRGSVYAFDMTGKSQLYMEFWNGANQRIGVQAEWNPSAASWNQVGITMKAPAGSAYATLLLYQCDDCIAVSYYDDASFREVSGVSSDPNLDFETVADGGPANWTRYSASSGAISVTDIVYSGQYSIRMDDTSPTAGIGMRSIHLPASPGEVYQASVQSYNASGISELYLEFWNSANQRIGVATYANSSIGKWTPLVIEQTAPAGTAYATLLLYSNSGNVGTAYFDAAGYGPLSPEPVREFPLLVSDHPRLYFTKQDLPAIRGKAANATDSAFGQTGKLLWSQLESVARGYLQDTSYTITAYGGHTVTLSLPPAQPQPMPNPPGFTDGVYPYWTAIGRAIQYRLEVLSLAYAVTQEQAFADKAKETVLSLTNWNTWTDPTYSCGSSCLDTSHLTLGVSMAYDILYDELSAAERTQIENALITKGLRPLYADVRSKVDHNIQMLRASALAAGASVVLGTDPDANKYLTRAANFISWYLDTRMSSGQQEGLGYTGYSLDNLMRAVDIMSRTTGLRDYIDHPFINDFFVRWVVYAMAPGGSYLANFSDSALDSAPTMTMSVINNWLGNGDAGYFLDKSRVLSDLVVSFLYFNPQAVISKPDTSLPSSATLDPIGWSFLRTGWEKEDTMLAFVSNQSALGHNHYDQNSFQIATNNAWIAADPGYQDLSAGPLKEFTIRDGHSTIQVDGKGQSRLGGGTLTQGMHAPGYDYVKGSAAAAYENPKLTKFDRHIVMIKPDYYVMFDDLSANANRTFDWVLNNGNISEFAIDGQNGTAGQTIMGNDLYTSNGKAALNAKFLSRDKLPITVGPYPGAESMGYLTKVSSGAASKDYRYVTVLKATPLLQPDVIQAEDLLPPKESSGKEFKIVNVDGAGVVFYRAETAGDYMTLEFELDKPGTYQVNGKFIQSPSYGKIQTYVDGQPVGDIFDGYDATVRTAAPFPLGQIELAAGKHTVKFELVGKNALSANTFIGVDGIQLTMDGTKAPSEPQKTLNAELLENDGVIGSKVWRGEAEEIVDSVLFKTGTSSYSVDGIASDADQSVVTRGLYGRIQGYAMTRGTSLQANGNTLLQASDPVNASVQGSYGRWEATLETGADGNVSLYVPYASAVTLNGRQLAPGEYIFDKSARKLSLLLSAGTHRIAIAADHPIEAPGNPVLSDDNGYDTGLLDGNYQIRMNLWWGNNGSRYRLYENGKLIDEQSLEERSPDAQSAVTAISGKANGTYVYRAELTNDFGTTLSNEHTVTVTQAPPAKAVLSHDNDDGDGSYRVTMNVWWGTNGTTYRLYENDVLIDSQQLADDTPNAQVAVTSLAGKPPGVYAYRCVLENAAGSTSSEVITVTVR
ncbi:heparinase II/III domain-containing protein [Cohnella hashimotonis]|uniref:Heparinase II/III family protein n=1 Tax=Cohnella hashimotonis TaxID=2826895 RepID=A0ABT6TGH0_9BACL|nr:heparinase II/III family protein [Cohnella hashimotonis]MDI4645024.1 heparinase II/III family protein [Cohnella hashimotonis]